MIVKIGIINGLIIIIFLGMASYNPWMVNSVHDFWFSRCPECLFDAKEEESFQAHALEKHPLSFSLFASITSRQSVLQECSERSSNVENETSHLKQNPISSPSIIKQGIHNLY